MMGRVQGSGWRVQGCGAAHKNMEAPRSILARGSAYEAA